MMTSEIKERGQNNGMKYILDDYSFTRTFDCITKLSNSEKSAILFVMLKISLKLSRRFLGSSLLVSRLYFVKSD